MNVRAAAASITFAVALVLGVAVVAPDAQASPGATTLVATAVTQTTIATEWQIADQHSPVIIGWQDESSPKGSSTWEGRYPAGTNRLTLTNLAPAHRYWIYVTLDSPGYEPTSTTVTTSIAPAVQPAAVKPVTAPSTPPATCASKTLASRTTAAAARASLTQIRVSGFVSYWTPAGWQPAPSVDYVLTVQRRTGATWAKVTTIKPGRAQIVTAKRGTYRLAFTGVCNQPVASSASAPFTK